MSVLQQNLGGIGKPIPYAFEISLDPQDFESWEISQVSGMDFPIPLPPPHSQRSRRRRLGQMDWIEKEFKPGTQ